MNKRMRKKISKRWAVLVRGIGDRHNWPDAQVREIVGNMLRCFGIKAVWR